MEYEIIDNKYGEMTIVIDAFSFEFDIAYEVTGRNFAGDRENPSEEKEVSAMFTSLTKKHSETNKVGFSDWDEIACVHKALEENIEEHYETITEIR